MHTPEPRAGGRAGNGALMAATPPVTEITPATPRPTNTDSVSISITPAGPRAGFLRRGNEALHGAIAAGPSVLFDDDGAVTPGTTTATTHSFHTSTQDVSAFDASPQPSQLTQLLQHPRHLPTSGQARLPRQRPRFHTVQDLDVALNQAIEGKITSRNAWASKEASDLLEGITHTIETTLDAAASDDYAGFAKAATVVEGCSKVWTSRVDSTYQQSNQMVQRLLRKDDTSSSGVLNDREDGGGEEDEEGQQQQQQQPGGKGRSRSAASAAASAAARTLAMEATEIDLDSKARTALTQTGVNAQFRAITSKFDQGNAQGLLMNNAPLGRAGNIILDVDYAALPGATALSAASGAGRGSNGRRISGIKRDAVDDSEVAMESSAPLPAARVSQHAVVEVDAAVYDSVLADLPPYRGVPTSGAVARSTRGSESLAAPPARDSVDSGDAARASQASTIDPLLLLPHAAPPKLETAELTRVSLKSEAGAAAAAASESAFGASGGDGGLRDGDDNDVAGGGDAFDDWGGDGGGIDDDDDNDNDNNNNNMMADGTGTESIDVSAAGRHASGVDRGVEARRLVSGAAEMEMIDTLFHGRTQLALEAEDPSSWCPLSEVPANPLSGVQGLSELSRLHREHRFAQSQRAAADSNSDRATATGVGSPPSGGTPAAKRARKERTVVFQLPDASGTTSAAPPLTTFDATSMAALLRDDTALRQATTAGRHVTPLGKQLLLAKDAAHAVLAYTQSAVQRSKAEQAGLLLPDAPAPGKTIHAYLPFPVHTQSFFQPFSTGLAHWNLLRKSATGHLVDSAAGGSAAAAAANAAAVGGGGGGAGAVGGRNSGNSHLDGGVHGLMGRGGAGAASEERDDAFRGYDDMPVEFFPGGAEVEAEDDGEAGGDYADYAECYGADDNDDDDAEEQRYVHGGFRGSAEAQLLAQMDAAAAAGAAAAAAAATGSAASGELSMRSSGTASDAARGADPLELLKVLSPPEATLPTQVDVVRLRQLMWDALQGHLSARQQTAAGDLATLRAGGAAAAAAAAAPDGGAASSAGVKGPVVKAHALAVLSKLRLRHRGGGGDEGEGKGGEDEGVAVTRAAENGHTGQLAEARDKRSTLDPFLSDEDTTSPTSAAAAGVALTRFSDVVRSVLPHVASVSSTNTLSPAFFFFSMLFLANEHNVVLQSVEGLDDLRACGIARRVGE